MASFQSRSQGTLAIQKRIYMGNNEAPNPDGWGLLVGGSLFRRIEFSNSFAGIPELFLAYDLQSITWHSSVINPISTAAISPGETTNYDHRARVLFRANMGFKAGPVVSHYRLPLRGLPVRPCGRGQRGCDFLATAPV